MNCAPHIVIVEDDPATQLFLNQVLDQSGYITHAYSNAQDALEYLKTEPADVVISDISMPHLDGFAFLKILRSQPHTATLPVVLLTMHQERNSVRLGMSEGADDYITKPFEPQEVLESIATQLKKRHARELAQHTRVAHKIEELRTLYETRLSLELEAQRQTLNQTFCDEHIKQAALIFISLPYSTELKQSLSPQAWQVVLKQLHTNINDTLNLFHARYQRWWHYGFLSMFAPLADDDIPHVRAIKAAHSLLKNLDTRFIRYQEEFAPSLQPYWRFHLSLHSGPVTLTHLTDAVNPTLIDTLAISQAVDETLAIAELAHQHESKVLASEAFMQKTQSEQATLAPLLLNHPDGPITLLPWRL